METISCPHCGAANPVNSFYAHPVERCAKCASVLVEPPPVSLHPSPPPSPYSPPRSYTHRTKAKSFGGTTAMILFPLLGAAVAVIPAILLSQHAPVFGGFIERGLAEPWSEARLSLMPVHLFAFCLAGAFVGLIAALATRQS